MNNISINSKNNRGLIIGFSLAILFQISILLVEYIGSALPIWTGQPIILKTEPIDPRSLFRGNYVALNYEINRIPFMEGAKKHKVVYVTLQIDENGVYHYESAHFEKPKHGIFIRGRIIDRHTSSRTNKKLMRVNYGIEAFFMPKEKALETERKARGKSEVIVYIGSNGKARGHSFSCLGDDCDIENDEEIVKIIPISNN